ncbi:adenine phosphoribosyltransferase isoform X1 [Narcine bancroftii]|uniref:adenine phosphoribosyltransferase isoform X1 n=1 Tax=Narcine bancroftii TaxID=1343680 RepID=UPI003831C8F8
MPRPLALLPPRPRHDAEKMSSEQEEKLRLVRGSVQTFLDFPKPGITFLTPICVIGPHVDPRHLTGSPSRLRILWTRSDIPGIWEETYHSGMAVTLAKDILPILKDPRAFNAVIDLLEDHLKRKFLQMDLIVGLDARGFFFGPSLAQRLGIGFVPIRKKGKLPGKIFSISYNLEYGEAELEIQIDSVKSQQKVVILDDLIATGGTLRAAYDLMKKIGADVLECLVVIEIKDLNGTEKLNCVPFHSLVQF